MKKIVYIISQPLDERNYDRFGIHAWIDKGWHVEVWDFTPWLLPAVWGNFLKNGGILKDYVLYYPILSKCEMKTHDINIKEFEYVMDFTGNSFYEVLIKIKFKLFGVKRVVFVVGSHPTPVEGVVNEFHKFRRVSFFLIRFKTFFLKLSRLSAAQLGEILFRKITEPYIRPNFIVTSGKKSMHGSVDIKKIIKAHSFDCDIFMRLREAANEPAKNYAVFIDQDYCFHPDFVRLDIPFFVTPEKYFPAICNGLRKISHVLDVNLQVAAHPRSSYQQRVPSCFEEIPIEYGRTAELIRDCKVVVCHNSTSVQFAVLFRKPIIFLTTDELNFSPAARSIAIFASELGKSVINVDGDLDSVDWEKELSVDSKKYDEYRNKYIKIDGSPETPHWDIVINHIEQDRRTETVG